MSLRMRKPTICLGENKGADQLRSNCEADQRLCFRHKNSIIPPLLVFTSFMLSLHSLFCVRPGRKPKLLVFSCTDSCSCTGLLNNTISCKHYLDNCISIFSRSPLQEGRIRVNRDGYGAEHQLLGFLARTYT